MSSKRFNELKNLSQGELVVKIQEAERQLFDAKMQLAVKELKDTALIWRTRKEIARLKTLQTSHLSSGVR